MDNRIKNAIESIAPTHEQKRRIYDAVSSRMEQGDTSAAAAARPVSLKRPLRVALIAAAAACVLCATVFAEEIGSYFSGFLTKDAVVSESVATGVYADSDGHVEMTVEELLTDNSCIRAVVHYRAVDEEGQSWLESLDQETVCELQKERKLWAWSDKFTSGGWMCLELTEYRTDNDAYFCLVTDCVARNIESVLLVYPMTRDSRETSLDIVKTLETKVYAINPEPTVFKGDGYEYYPTEVELSPLSVGVYGKQNGIAYFDKGDNGWSAYMLIDDYDYTDIVSSLRLVRADGTKLDLTGGTLGLRQQSYYDEYEPEDFIFYFNSFDEPVDANEFTGIEFDGVYFPFEA